MNSVNETLELKEDNDKYRETFYTIKSEIARIRKEYFLGAISMSETSIDEVDSELEIITLAIENILF
jgi:hypothetical protein